MYTQNLIVVILTYNYMLFFEVYEIDEDQICNVLNTELVTYTL
jgi:hypothetical protein